VRDIVEKSVDVETTAATDALLQDVSTEEDLHRLPVKYSEQFLKTPFDSAPRNVADRDDVQDATEYNDDVQDASEVDFDDDDDDDDDDGDYAAEYVEEKILSLQEIERQAILKALERHDGVRRFAARDLEISERTLYRKIREYNLEDL
jgi:DNA-binding NtrC family response regulator